MTDIEYEVLDELYFVISYSDLKEQTGIGDAELKKCLKQLFDKKWIVCFKSVSEELPVEEVNLNDYSEKYFYLASKKGLFAHNKS
ncbi:hypothetical protein [Flexithrix dorotheae]|uniref:hypothetical protein n=1 Tax=Flexithrix dorotheae TaxID=70993 RepID=UPI000369CD89|nr:hypothetical protein [Flexithrix dorotheae]